MFVTQGSLVGEDTIFRFRYPSSFRYRPTPHPTPPTLTTTATVTERLLYQHSLPRQHPNISTQHPNASINTPSQRVVDVFDRLMCDYFGTCGAIALCVFRSTANFRAIRGHKSRKKLQNLGDKARKLINRIGKKSVC
jgi:hypothetical protein